jgi:hypothetical protein
MTTIYAGGFRSGLTIINADSGPAFRAVSPPFE